MPAPYACGRTGGGGVQAPHIHGYIGLESIWSLVSTSTLPSFLLFLAITSCFLPTACIRFVILHCLILDLLFLLLYMDHVESFGSPYAYQSVII